MPAHVVEAHTYTGTHETQLRPEGPVQVLLWRLTLSACSPAQRLFSVGVGVLASVCVCVCVCVCVYSEANVPKICHTKTDCGKIGNNIRCYMYPHMFFDVLEREKKMAILLPSSS